MAIRDQLMTAGLRAYERGRLRAAARIAAVILPVVALAALASGETELCACLGLVLLGVAMFFRWRNRSGRSSVTTGFVAGSWSLLAGLALSRVSECPADQLLGWCASACLAVGLGSGAWVGWRTVREHRGISDGAIACAVAALVGILGCVNVGLGGVLGVMMGLTAGSAVGALTARPL